MGTFAGDPACRGLNHRVPRGFHPHLPRGRIQEFAHKRGSVCHHLAEKQDVRRRKRKGREKKINDDEIRETEKDKKQKGNKEKEREEGENKRNENMMIRRR